MNLWGLRRSPSDAGNQGDDDSAALARHCLTLDGLLDAPTAEASYRQLLPSLPPRPPPGPRVRPPQKMPRLPQDPVEKIHP